ncbi:MAG: hypothetical protein ACTHWA_07335 [Arachnia sp.]
MIDSFQDFVTSLPPLLQWLGVMAISAIPFIESYFGSVIGVIAGVPAPIAIISAVLGNVASMVALVLGAHAVRDRVRGPKKAQSPRYERLHKAFDKYGVAGVSLLGQSILPSQITSAALVSFGAAKNKVIFWQIISIILWGTAFGLMAMFGVDVLTS